MVTITPADSETLIMIPQLIAKVVITIGGITS